MTCDPINTHFIIHKKNILKHSHQHLHIVCVYCIAFQGFQGHLGNRGQDGVLGATVRLCISNKLTQSEHPSPPKLDIYTNVCHGYICINNHLHVQ